MKLGRLWFFCAILALPLAGSAAASDATVSLTGKVVHPQQFDLAHLQKLPSQHVDVTFQTDRGPQQASYTGVLLWSLIGEAGGIDDSAKNATLHHMIKITAKDGYWILLSASEIEPGLGGKQALVAYQRGDDAPGVNGFRLVMPGDKHGARYVRDIAVIDVE
jgi:hypothetical protein